MTQKIKFEVEEKIKFDFELKNTNLETNLWQKFISKLFKKIVEIINFGMKFSFKN
jgi:hypothetical protein